MKSIGLFVNRSKPRAKDVLARIEAEAARLGLALYADAETAAQSGTVAALAMDEMPGTVDCLMAVGGDGTMLRAVRELGDGDLPVLGLNIGSLGFMTSVAEDSLERALKCLADDSVQTSPRTMLHCRVVSADGSSREYVGLNDVVLQGKASSRVITLNMDIDGEEVASYVCDGLIVATPTGSTGHSLSAGGPIIMPGTHALVISVICPHSLSARPLVIGDDSRLTFRCPHPSEHGLFVSVDGQVGEDLTESDVVHVARSPREIQFIHLPGYSYFPVLRQKLGWRGSHV